MGPPTMALSGGAAPKVIVCEPRSLSWTLIVDPAAGATTWAQGASCEPDGGVTVTNVGPVGSSVRLAPPEPSVGSVAHSVPEAVPPKRGNEVGAHGRSTLAPGTGAPAGSVTETATDSVGSWKVPCTPDVRSTAGTDTAKVVGSPRDPEIPTS